MVGWSMSAKRNDEHTHKCDDWTEEYLVWKQEMVVKPEVIYVSYLFILGQHAKNEVTEYSVMCSIFELQSALWAIGNWTYRVICEAKIPMFTEYSVNPPILDLQSTLYVHFFMVHRVLCKSHTEWRLSHAHFLKGSRQKKNCKFYDNLSKGG